MAKSHLIAARKPRGFADRRGRDAAGEERIVRAVGRVYERWGFEQLDTPAVEFTEALGKFLPDQERPNAAVFSFQDDDEWLSLRYDLTAPLARFAAEEWDRLPKPYRRWQTGPVWRNEKVGPGRFRQFIQCDADTVGAAGPAADAEMVAMGAEALEEVGVPRGGYVFKINTRLVLNGVLESIGVDPAGDDAVRLTILRAIDKLDRLGLEGVGRLLGKGRKDESGDFTPGAGLDAAAVEKILAFVSIETGSRDAVLASLEPLVSNSEDGRRGLAELSEIDAVLSATGVGGDRAQFDPSVVRGLEYYTGAVFEAGLLMTSPETGKPVSVGSVGGGGRYDDLISRFRSEAIPATGFSIGVSRLAAALDELGAPKVDAVRNPVVVLALDSDAMGEYFAMAAELREAGVPAEVYLGASGMRAQMKYADRRNAPFVVICGEDERQRGVVRIKDLALGETLAAEIQDREQWKSQAQFDVERSELVAAIKKRTPV